MKMSTAHSIINTGYRVRFNWIDRNNFDQDYFPEKDEPLIDTEQEAWELAKKFADKTVSQCANIYVVTGDFIPVTGYDIKTLNPLHKILYKG
jgi:hypothetical protein